MSNEKVDVPTRINQSANLNAGIITDDDFLSDQNASETRTGYIGRGDLCGRHAQTAARAVREMARCAAVTLLAALGALGVLGAVGVAGSEGGRSSEAPDLAQLLPPLLGASLEELVRVASNSCDALPLDALYSQTHVPDIQLIEYGQGSQLTYPLSVAHQRLRVLLPAAPAASALPIYVPGWWNTPHDDSSTAIVTALLNRHETVLLLDTRPVFCKGYIASAAGVGGLAHRLYKFIKSLHAEGWPLSSVRLIGFSLGAHVAGVTGKLVRKHLHQRLERIVALDPARPCFARPSRWRLASGDASFVQVVHTSAGVLGLAEPLGHADVYANGVLAPQPECEDRSAAMALGCDHAQAWRLYAASVSDARVLSARRCANWAELNDGGCAGAETSLGYSCSADSRGLYLYKSPAPARKREPQLRVFNPLDLFGWLLQR
ncbi:PREDICTED: lipase member H-B-like [Papilio xuthus]|uniref:Lipase member H-B-like n=1 Tax=Papilio xuthus TaxID=66420 RepID=A0AAJ6ZF02_PAPXU|nr:PREDICTED: lipase member H-B-like [Papilio xuthus]